MYRIMLLMRKEFLQFLRNVPLIIIVLYCMTIDVMSAGTVSMDIKNFPLAIYDMDHSEQVLGVIERLREPYFRIARVLEGEDEITELIESGEISVVVVFPHGFGKKLSSYQTAEMQVIMDGSLSGSAQLALGYISEIVQKYNGDILFSKWKVSPVTKTIVPYIEARRRYMFNPNLTDSWNFSMQEMFIDITLIGILLIATAMVNEKQFGTIEQLMVTPLKIHEIMIAKIVPMVVILLIGTFIAVFVTLRSIMEMPIAGSMIQFFFVTLIYVFTVAGMGMMISTISSNLSDTVLFSILILVPIMFLSGAFVPIESMPDWMQAIMHLSPLKYYIDLGSGIFMKGNSIFLMWRDMVMLIVLGSIWFAIGAIRFRKVFR